MLLARTQSSEKRNHLGLRAQSTFDQIRTFPNIPLTRQENEHIPDTRLEEEALTLTGSRIDEIGVGRIRRSLFTPGRAVLHIHRKGAPGHLNDGRIVERLGESHRIDGGRGNDHLQVRALSQKVLQVPQQEIDVQRALMGFIDDDGFVFGKGRIPLHLGQKHAIGHQLNDRVRPRSIIEADLTAHFATPGHIEFLSDSLGDGQCRHPPGLRTTDHRPSAQARFQAHFWNLSRFARPRLTSNNHHWVRSNRGHDVLLAGGDRQPRRILRARQGLRSILSTFDGSTSLLQKTIQRMSPLAHRPPLPHPPGRARSQSNPVREHTARQQLPEFINARVGHAVGAQSMGQDRREATPRMAGNRDTPQRRGPKIHDVAGPIPTLRSGSRRERQPRDRSGQLRRSPRSVDL